MAKTNRGWWQRAFRRARWRLRRLWLATPALRRHLPLALAVGVNALLALLIMSMGFVRAPRGLPDSPTQVTVFVVPPEDFPQLDPESEEDEPEPEPDREEPPEFVDILPEEVVSTPTPDEEDENPPPPPPPVREASDAGIALPEVTLPTVDPGAGVQDGIVALSCYDQFSDPDKAAECAGRAVLSGWQADVAKIGEGWDSIARGLNRGKVPIPYYGPDRYGDLAPNERLYAPQNPRYLPQEDMFLGRYREAFDSREEYEKFLAMRDPRKSFNVLAPGSPQGYGGGESVPLSGWQPSWMLREDPVLDNDDLKAIFESDTVTDE